MAFFATGFINVALLRLLVASDRRSMRRVVDKRQRVGTGLDTPAREKKRR